MITDQPDACMSQNSVSASAAVPADAVNEAQRSTMTDFNFIFALQFGGGAHTLAGRRAPDAVSAADQ